MGRKTYAPSMPERPPWLCGDLRIHNWDECPVCLMRRARYYQEQAMPEQMVFDTILPKSIVVKITNPKAVYRLHEASEGAAIAYRDATFRARKYNDSGEAVGWDGLAESEAVLVSECLYFADEDGNVAGEGDKVPLAAIKKWKQSVVSWMFDWVMDNSGLRREEETEESLTKQIVDLQRRRGTLLAQLRSTADGNGDGDTAKNSPSAMAATSG